MTDVSGVAGAPGVGHTVEHQSAAHAGGHHHGQQEARTPPRALPLLPQRHAHAVTTEAHRHAGHGGRDAVRNGKPCQLLMLIGLTVPLSRSMGPAEAIPTARTAPPALPKASAIIAATASHTCSAEPFGGVGRVPV